MRFDADKLQPALVSGLEALGLDLGADRAHDLIRYLALLHRWNRAFNLTAVRDPHAMVSRHLLDSLAVTPFVPSGGILDLGSGAGLPGIPLAIALPDRRFTLLDSNGKKTRFLRQAAVELGLANVNVVHSRVEAYRPDVPYDAVVARAVASLFALFEASRHLMAPGGCLLAMKGDYPDSELKDLPAGSVITDIVALQVPGTEGARHLIRVRAESVEA